jgi:putative Holliday junction resolvase
VFLILRSGPKGRVSKDEVAHRFDLSVLPLDELGATVPPGKRLLGLDLGTKTIGLALSDATLTIATAMGTLAKAKFTADAAEIARLVAEHDVGGIVIGLPVNMDGSEGPRAQSARQFAANLAGRVPVSIALWDERLSTAAVTRTLIEADASRHRRRALTDKLAAAYILQGALDYLARRRETAAR